MRFFMWSLALALPGVLPGAAVRRVLRGLETGDAERWRVGVGN